MVSVVAGVTGGRFVSEVTRNDIAVGDVHRSWTDVRWIMAM